MKKNIVIIIIFIFLIISCKREREGDESLVLYQEQRAENIIAEDIRISNISNDNNQAVTLNPVASEIQRSRVVPVNVGNHNLLREQNRGIVTPEDFEIGPLLVSSNRIDEEIQNKLYKEFINNFFTELREHNIPASMILSESLFFLTNIFNFYIEREQIPDNIRIGRVFRTPDGLKLNLRMFKGNNRTEGQIVLVETDNGLRVRRFHGDLGMLDVEYTGRNEKFEPEFFRF
ncbi:MAG: hypothetical protein FWC36_09080 [Spirochaetes bacterium]|nr:hypothetical protein [Spirochaetota bacterium]